VPLGTSLPVAPALVWLFLTLGPGGDAPGPGFLTAGSAALALLGAWLLPHGRTWRPARIALCALAAVPTLVLTGLLVPMALVWQTG
jgi:hypothetical protein